MTDDGHTLEALRKQQIADLKKTYWIWSPGLHAVGPRYCWYAGTLGGRVLGIPFILQHTPDHKILNPL